MKKLERRTLLQLVASAAVLTTLSAGACAQTYPARPAHLIVGFAPGSGPDIIARLTGEWLSERLGQQFIVENRPGAASNIAAGMVVRAQPDGYTLLEITSANAINATLYAGLDFARDIAPVASVASAAFVLVVEPTFSAKTLTEFIAQAKANPGKFNVGSSSTGTTPYMSAVLFKIMAGIDVLHVPFRSTPQAITELLGGRIELVVADMSAIEFIKAGKLRALAVTTTTRQDALPDVPTVADVVPGYEATTWYGLGAPKSTPSEIIERLNTATNAALAEPKNKTQLADMAFTVTAGSPADFENLIAKETEKWGKVTRATNLKPE
jgi:tripartite-type tricarboxylate transporter receptor subunit TctC